MILCQLFVFILCVAVTTSEKRFVIGSATTYRVTVVTADEKSAGTHSNVFLAITGTHGITQEQQLNQNGAHDFGQGKVDQFLISGASVGNITSIHVRHDNHGHNSAWKLEKITIEDGQGVYEFPCDCWLDKHHPPATLSATIKLGNYLPIS